MSDPVERPRFQPSLTLEEAVHQSAVNFMMSVYHKQTGEKAGSVIDIACRVGDYACQFAARKLSVIGLETRPDLLQLARRKAESNDINVQWVLEDMRHFSVAEPVDLAVCLGSGVSQLLSNEDWMRHLNAVANALTPNGIYIIELPHPRENSFTVPLQQTWAWEMEGVRVQQSWPIGQVEVDLVNGASLAEEELRIEENSETFIKRTKIARRVLNPQEIPLLALQSGSMRLVDYYGGFDTDQPLDNSTRSQAMIAVLQKVEIPLSYISPKLEVRPSKDKGDGFGAFALEKIGVDELLVAYGGDVVTSEQLTTLSSDPHRYSLQIEEDLYLTSKGTLADYINHSCNPNAGMQGPTMLVAMREIQAGEEVCWDYATSDGSPYDEFLCTCGADECRHRITGNDWRIPALWLRYEGYFSPYLQRRIDRIRELQPGVEAEKNG